MHVLLVDANLLAAFCWEQPTWLVAALALAAALRVHAGVQRRAVRLARQAASAPAPAPAEADEPIRQARRQTAVRWLASLAGAGVAAGLGAALGYIGTSGAFVLLGSLALVAACWLTSAGYRAQQEGLTLPARVALTAVRCLAWLILLAILARPVWDWVVVDWQKPLLVVLLDQSDSMAIVDPGGRALGQSRAAQVNVELVRARAAVDRLAALHEIRLRGVGSTHEALSTWEIVPRAPVSALTSALRDAGAMRSQHGAAPVAVLLVSDGAENVSPPDELRRAAAELAAQGTALWTVGVGPAPGETPVVELEPLALPARLGLRERLRVPVAARVQGCSGSPLTVELRWDTEPPTSQPTRIERDVQRVSVDFDLVPPGPGVHRLTARMGLPPSRGGGTFQTSAIVDVRDDRIRVLWVEGTPRVETAFVTRLLQADPQVELTRRFLFSGAGQKVDPFAGETNTWAEYDVVVLGGIPPVLSDALLADLARAVTERSVGLLLTGGRRFFNDDDYRHTPLAGVCPVDLANRQVGLAGPVRFVPTERGLRHAVLQGAAASDAGAPSAPAADERAPWLSLPPLGGAAGLGNSKPAAAVLAEDGAGHALLVAQEIGQGRSVASALESTWPWALASEEGAATQRRLWRQLVVWLANRRPRAWVLTDQPTYPLAALTDGQRHVRVRAGIAGLEALGPTGRAPIADAHLVLVARGQRRELPLVQQGDEWTAELSGALADVGFPAAGEYRLEFSAHGGQALSTQAAPDQGGGRLADIAAARRGDDQIALDARTSFSIVETPPERQPPTANLSLLKAAAEETVKQGGTYRSIQELPELLRKFAQTDRRQETRTRRRYGAVEREPWPLLGAFVILLSVEWGIRKRAGLA